MTRLSPNVFAGAQIAPGDLDALALQGFTDVVCNRPDEEEPNGAASPIMAGRAAGLGLRFHYLPIRPGEPPIPQARALAGLALEPGTKIFAYCRSGARSATAWALAEAELAALPGQAL